MGIRPSSLVDRVLYSFPNLFIFNMHFILLNATDLKSIPGILGVIIVYTLPGTPVHVSPMHTPGVI